MAVIDLPLNLVLLLQGHWVEANMERSFTPVIDRDAELEAWNAHRRICVREMQSGHRSMDLCNAVQEVTRLYQIDLYALNREDALDMREEVDRIINEHNSDPVTGIVFLTQTKWEDMTGSAGNYFRYVCSVSGTSYVNA